MHTSILTGQPTQKIKQLQKELDRRKLQEQVDKAIVLAEDVKTADGQSIVGRIRKVLEERIVVLLKSDPECQSLLKVLNEIGTELAIAQSVAAKLAQIPPLVE